MDIPKNRIIELFLQLVTINAVSRSEKAVADFIRAFIKPLRLRALEDGAGKAVDGDSGNIIIRANSTDRIQPIALMAHMDTIKPTLGIQPRVNNGKISSNGSTILGADNRAGIAIILSLIEHLTKNKLPHRPFEAVFTIGEETGLFGSTHLDMQLVESRTAYVLDSSADPGSYVYSAPGALELEIQFLGKASHAAVHPDKGINALTMAAVLIHNFPIGQLDPETTINFGKICGGEANNVIPSRIDLTGEIRSFKKEKVNHYKQQLEKQLCHIKEQFGGDFNLHSHVGFPGFELDTDTEPFKRLNDSLRSLGIAPKALKYHGGSDANVLNNRGMIAIDLGIGAKNPHSTDEYIKVDDLHTMTAVMLHLLTN